jgi:hypothetical protein
LPLFLVLAVIGGLWLISQLIPVYERWSARRAQAKREQLAYERCETLLALMTVDPMLAERIYDELGKWKEELR